MLKMHCGECGGIMQRWGHTRGGKPRFFCASCRKTATRDRDDVEKRHALSELNDWLGGKDSLNEIAKRSHKTRQALWKKFHPLLSSIPEPTIPDLTKVKQLILDATYIHGHTLCALVAIDENNQLYWKFAPYESYKVWCHFLSSFAEPEIVIMDGQKGLFAAAKTLWPKVAVQRCQFHVIAFAIQYLGRRPKEQVGKDLLDILYRLKDAKTLKPWKNVMNGFICTALGRRNTNQSFQQKMPEDSFTVLESEVPGSSFGARFRISSLISIIPALPTPRISLKAG